MLMLLLLCVWQQKIVHQVGSFVDIDRRWACRVLYHRVLHRWQELVPWRKGFIVRVSCLGLDFSISIRLVCTAVGKVAACFIPLLRVDWLLWSLLCLLSLLLFLHQLKLYFSLQFFVLLPFLSLFRGLPPLVFLSLSFEFFLVHFPLHFLPLEFRWVNPIKSFGKRPVNLIGICYGRYSLSHYVHFPACEREDIVEWVILVQ